MRETGTLPKKRADAQMRRWTDGRSARQKNGKWDGWESDGIRPGPALMHPCPGCGTRRPQATHTPRHTRAQAPPTLAADDPRPRRARHPPLFVRTRIRAEHRSLDEAAQAAPSAVVVRPPRRPCVRLAWMSAASAAATARVEHGARLEILMPCAGVRVSVRVAMTLSVASDEPLRLRLVQLEVLLRHSAIDTVYRLRRGFAVRVDG